MNIRGIKLQRSRESHDIQQLIFHCTQQLNSTTTEPSFLQLTERQEDVEKPNDFVLKQMKNTIQRIEEKSNIFLLQIKNNIEKISKSKDNSLQKQNNNNFIIKSGRPSLKPKIVLNVGESNNFAAEASLIQNSCYEMNENQQYVKQQKNNHERSHSNCIAREPLRIRVASSNQKIKTSKNKEKKSQLKQKELGQNYGSYKIMTQRKSKDKQNLCLGVIGKTVRAGKVLTSSVKNNHRLLSKKKLCVSSNEVEINRQRKTYEIILSKYSIAMLKAFERKR